MANNKLHFIWILLRVVVSLLSFILILFLNLMICVAKITLRLGK